MIEAWLSAAATSGLSLPAVVPAGRVDHRASTVLASAAKSASGSFIRSCQGPKTGIVGRRPLPEIAAPSGHDLGPQVLGGQRQEEDRRLERVGLGQGGADQVIADALAGRLREQGVLAVEELPQLGPLGVGLLLELDAAGPRLRALDERQLEGASLLAKTP